MKKNKRQSKKSIAMDGTEKYRLGPKLHREDGFAIIFPGGAGEYWIEGKKVTAEELSKYVKSKEYEFDFELILSEEKNNPDD